MKQAWADVENLLTEVRPHLLRAGVPQRQLTMPDATPDDIKVERFVEIFDWLHKLKTGPEFLALLKVWKLVAPDVWERYKLLDIKGLQEQILLEKAQIVLRKAWKQNRPFFFGRKFKTEEPNGDSPSTDTEPTTEATTEQDGNPEGAAVGDIRSKGKRTPPHHRRRGRPRVLRGEGEGISGDPQS